MKTILITENQFKKLIENIINEQDNNRELELLRRKWPMDEWFYENIVKKVEQKTYLKYPDKIFYVNKNTNEPYMRYDKKNGDLWVDYKTIWKYFEFNYIDDFKEIQRLIKDLVGERYGLGGITPYFWAPDLNSWWKNLK